MLGDFETENEVEPPREVQRTAEVGLPHMFLWHAERLSRQIGTVNAEYLPSAQIERRTQPCAGAAADIEHSGRNGAAYQCAEGFARPLHAMPLAVERMVVVDLEEPLAEHKLRLTEVAPNVES